MSQTDYVLTGTADPVLEFQAGDILGLFQPRESRSRVRVYYDTSPGPTNYYIDDTADQPSLTSFVIANAGGMEDHLPLVTIEIGKPIAEVPQADIYIIGSWKQLVYMHASRAKTLLCSQKMLCLEFR